jgi:cyclic beta-1,2-glucan synthetase
MPADSLVKPSAARRPKKSPCRAFVRQSSRRIRHLMRALNAAHAPRWLDAEAATRTVEMCHVVLRHLPAFAKLDAAGRSGSPRIVSIAEDYLAQYGANLSAATLVAHLHSLQTTQPFDYSEVTLLGPAVSLCLLLKLGSCFDNQLHAGGDLLSGLDAAAQLYHSDYIPAVLSFEPLLIQDPAGLYSRLADRTKLGYRASVARLAAFTRTPERRLAAAAVDLARAHPVHPDERMRLRSHIGFYLLDPAGIAELCASLGHRAPWSYRLGRNGGIRYFLAAYALITAALTGTICAPLISHLSGWPLLPLIVCIVFVAGNCAVQLLLFVILPRITQPRQVASLKFASGIPPEYATVVAVPALLLDLEHLSTLVRTLQDHYRMAADPSVYIGLLTDFPDSTERAMQAPEQQVLARCVAEIERLNREAAPAGVEPFFLLHRERVYCTTEGRWIGWERKRGKIEQLADYVAGIGQPFSVTAGCTGRLRHAQYALILDDDTRLAPGAVQKLVAAHAHPLNHPHVSGQAGSLERGFGILMPTVMTVRYIRAPEDRNRADLLDARDLIFDFAGQTPFAGKGLVHLSAYRAVVHKRLPLEFILNHDVVESGLLPTATVAEAGVLEPSPTNRYSYYKRQHRWVRGNWQHLPFVLRISGIVPRLSLFGKTLICQNLMDSIFPIALSVAVLICTIRHPAGLLWVALLLLTPIICSGALMAVNALCSADGWRWAEGFRLIGAGVVGGLRPAFRALYESVVYSDAIARTMVRLATKRNLLEWESSVVTERSTKGGRQLGMFGLRAAMAAVLLGMTAPLFFPSATIPVFLLALFWIAGSLAP